MNRNKSFVLGSYVVLGIALIAGGILLKIDYYDSMMIGCGVGFSLSGLLHLLREYRNTRPENRAAYEQKMKEQQINLQDERKVFLRYLAGYRMYQLTFFLCFFGSAVCSLLRVDAKIVATLFVIAILEYAAGTIVYKSLCRKM